jgi:hypothetical protein
MSPRRSLLGRSGACVAILLGVSLVFAGWASAPIASARVPAKFWGVVPQILPTEGQYQRIKRGGVDSVRVTLLWSAVEPTKGGSPNWSGVDQVVARAARNGLELLPSIYGSPGWVAKPENTLPVRTAKQRSAWTGFLKALVHRYGPTGSFWAANPGVPRRPIRVWQIWNEENFFYFAARPSPAQYAKLVKISHRAIAGADGGAKVLLGGMFALPAERPPKAYAARRFLELMYKKSPGIKASFDGVALHPYSRSYIYLKPTIRQVRAVMRAHGDGGTGLWITELGWGSGHGGNSFEKGRKGQARQLKGAFNVLRNNRRKWHIKRVFWFSLDDLAGSCNFCDSSGLFGAGFKPKPSWYAYTKFSGGNPNASRPQSAARAYAQPRSPTVLFEHPAGWPGP